MLPVCDLVTHARALEAVGWSLALTKQWESYAHFRQDLLPFVRRDSVEALIAILDSWRAIHEARYDASLVNVRNVQSQLMGEAAPRLLSHALKVEGVALFRMGRYDEAEALTRRAQGLFALAGDMLQEAHCATNLGLILNARGEIRAARVELQHAIAALIESEVAEERVALARENLAVVEVHLGNVVHARELYDAALATFEKLGLRSEKVTALNGLGQCARLQGRFDEAQQLFETALRDAAGMPRQVGLCHEFLGQIHFDRGDFEAAEEHYLLALDTAASIAPDGDLMVEASWRHAELLARVGKPEEAGEHLTRAETLCAQNHDRRELGCVQRARAHVLAAAGRDVEARVAFETAAATLESTGRRFEATLTRLLHGEAELAAGEGEVAAALFARAQEEFTQVDSDSPWVARAGTGHRAADSLRSRAGAARAERYGFVTADADLLYMLDHLPAIATTEHAVLIEGESGTGKELVARAVHALSGRRGSFVAVNCAALPRDLFESELFGHARGAFSGAQGEKPGLLEQATDGTLLLDEVGDLPPDLQAKLLRVLDNGVVRRVGELRERRVHVKIVAATNRPLRPRIDGGRFRLDLFHRLAVHHLQLKPLRQRAGDIELLARHLVRSENLREQLQLTPELLAELEHHAWPGNVRELRNELIRRATQIHPTVAVSVSGTNRSRSLRESRAAHERRLIENTLTQTSGNVTGAARSLGMHVTTLRRKMRSLGVRRPS
jgi:transcriptional regulator with AAA-type ATPase domain/Flp pilus assembly protein TadD